MRQSWLYTLIMDDTIKTEEDIEKYLGVSVLAKVPDRKDYVNMKNKKPKSNKKNKKRARVMEESEQ